MLHVIYNKKAFHLELRRNNKIHFIKFAEHVE